MSHARFRAPPPRHARGQADVSCRYYFALRRRHMTRRTVLAAAADRERRFLMAFAAWRYFQTLRFSPAAFQSGRKTAARRRLGYRYTARAPRGARTPTAFPQAASAAHAGRASVTLAATTTTRGQLLASPLAGALDQYRSSAVRGLGIDMSVRSYSHAAAAGSARRPFLAGAGTVGVSSVRPFHIGALKIHI